MQATMLSSTSNIARMPVSASAKATSAQPARFAMPVRASADQPSLAGRRAVLSVGLAAGLAGLVGRPGAALAADGVTFVSPKNGAKVAGPVPVQMTVSGLEVKPASEGLIEGTGHHHIVVDGGAVPVGEAIPFDATHLHFGKGQTEASLDLAPGKHTLTLQFANAKHESYGPSFSKTITVNVQ